MMICTNLIADVEAEIHARPYPLVTAPTQTTFVAALVGPGQESAVHRHVCETAQAFGSAAPPPGVTSFAAVSDHGELRWERHEEYYVYTLIRSAGVIGAPFEQSALDMLPPGWLGSLAGELFAACHIVFEPASRPEYTRSQLHSFLGGERLIGSRVIDDCATLWTTMRAQPDGFGRVLVHDRALNNCRAGRLLQRLIDIEIHRALALHALPLARETAPTVLAIDRSLGHLIEAIAGAHNIDDERDLLKNLSELARDIERTRASTSIRFQAAREYSTTLYERVHELRESDIYGVLTIGQFLDRRMAPAMRQCERTAALADDVSVRIGRASDLLRTRIDLTLEAQNQTLLASMEQRARLQLHLQRTIEGVSIAAVAYYLLGLLKAGVEGLNADGIRVNGPMVCLVALPVILGILWNKSRRLDHGIDRMSTLDQQPRHGKMHVACGAIAALSADAQSAGRHA